MVADGLSIINADYSSTSFRVSRTSIGAHNFLGNHIAYPAAGPDGRQLPARRRRSWSRSTARSAKGVGPARLAQLRDPALGRARQPVRPPARRRRAAPPAAPPRTGTTCAPSALFLLARWLSPVRAHPASASRRRPVRTSVRGVGARGGPRSPACVFTVVYFVLVERRLDRLPAAARRRCCSIYDRDFWRHERFWKLHAAGLLQMLQRHPVQERSSGGCWASGSAAGSSTTAAPSPSGRSSTHRRRLHAQRRQHASSATRRRTAPSSPTASSIGAGCTLGVGAFVHYGVTMGDGAVLAPDSFLMKGEEVPPHARWGGNPAREIAEHPPVDIRRRPHRRIGLPPWHQTRPDDRRRRVTKEPDRGLATPAGLLARRARRRRVHRDPAVDARPGDRASPSTRCRSRRQVAASAPAGGRAGVPLRRCCWPRTPRCWPRCPASARSSTGYVAGATAGRCRAG